MPLQAVQPQDQGVVRVEHVGLAIEGISGLVKLLPLR
jgi:hypothetical protein